MKKINICNPPEWVDPAHEIYKAPRKRHDDRFSEDLPGYMFKETDND